MTENQNEIKIDPAKQRVEAELDELKAKLDKLKAFTAGCKPNSRNLESPIMKLDIDNRRLLLEQESIMSDYVRVLEARLKLWKSL